MDQPIEVVCETCGSRSQMLKNSYIDASGDRVEWPRASVRPDGIYFAIKCPTCGEREQCLARAQDES